MPRSKKTNRRRSTLRTVSTKPKGIAKPIGQRVPKSERFQASSLTYDVTATQFANYGRLGLMADANQIGVSHEQTRITGFNPRVKVPAGTAPEPTGSAPHPLEDEVPEGLKTIRKVPDGERQVLLKLQAVHGADYGAMARDMRLNQLQHTAAHIRRRIEKMRREDEEDAAEAAAAGTPAPSETYPRGRKKTKDPNPAFKKTSKHFN
mmetsp:Transcript_17672/g.35601  ORF Transcript_17672/g.35601 Transcript_17672/m.35601 type:complete len:206 (-) Transcript_17672:134-751(-)